MGENVEKPQLVNFIAKVLEDAGFRVYKNFKTSQQVIDIYAILPTSIGDFGVVCACKNYDKEWEVGIDVLKEMEIIGKQLKASKVAIITSSSFSSQAQRYGEEKKMKLVDRTNLVALAKRYSEKIKNDKEPARLDRKVEEAPKSYEINAEDIENPYQSPEYEPAYNPYDDYDDYESDMEYYESQVGGIDLSGYSEYDDELYRAAFLNKTQPKSYYEQPRQTLVSRNSHHQQESRSRFRRSSHNDLSSGNSHRRNNPQGHTSRFMSRSEDVLSKVSRPVQKERAPLGVILKPILSNTIVIIAIVVLVTYLIAYILGNFAKVPAGYLGLVELIVAFLLSYAFALYAERSSDILVKGTVIFFISLVILMIAMVAL